MKAYLNKWVTTPFVSNDRAEGARALPRLLQGLIEKFNLGGENCLLVFSYRLEVQTPEETIMRYIVMDKLKLEDSILSGCIGFVNMTMEAQIQYRDIKTMAQSEVVPPNADTGYEYSTHFALNASKQDLLVLKKNDMPEYIRRDYDNVNRAIATICTQAIGTEAFNFKVESYLEKTIRERISEMKNSKIKARILVAETDLELKGSIKRLLAKKKGKGYFALSMSLDFNEILDDDEIDNLLALKNHSDIKRLIIEDTDGFDEEVNILKEMVKSRREIDVKAHDIKHNPELVREKMVNAVKADYSSPPITDPNNQRAHKAMRRPQRNAKR